MALFSSQERRVAAAALAAAAGVAGCGSQASRLGEVGVYGDDAGVFTGGSADGGGGFAVSAGAAQTVCAGQCTTLSAQATGGKGPYSFAWDHGLTGGAGPIRVCPTASTTYGVTAHDSSGSAGELAIPDLSASASVTVAVGTTSPSTARTTSPASSRAPWVNPSTTASMASTPAGPACTPRTRARSG